MIFVGSVLLADSVRWVRDMPWAAPKFSRARVDEAGVALTNADALPPELDEALEVINNWRSSHAYPLNTFQATLRYKARQVSANPLVAQRIKRLSSIYQKLRRFSWLKLSEMQDIGGCRAIVDSTRQVDRLVTLYKKSDLKHKLDDEDDYIRNPKRSGYRGFHLIYRYNSDKIETYNGLKIEMQFRSPLQHAWACAVETVGTFTRQALKASQGEENWLRFFKLMGTAMGLRERTPPVPDTPTKKEDLSAELREYARRLDVENCLHGYGAALQITERPSLKGMHYFLIELDAEAKQTRVRGYTRGELEEASNEYLEAERKISGNTSNAVLVSVDSMSALRRAYPSYFLDTEVFIQAVRQALGR